jgi:hypothetical protein
MSRLKNLLMFSALPITIWRDFFWMWQNIFPILDGNFSNLVWQEKNGIFCRMKTDIELGLWHNISVKILILTNQSFFLLQNIRINPNLVIKFLNLSLFFLKTILSKVRSIWLRLLLTYYDWLYIKRKNK